MHPAFSVIVFTTSSGAGYGLLAWLGILAAIGRLPGDRFFGAVSLALALGAITVGLLSSTFHLGHPERAWRAFSQWRSSWLSREGVVSVATYLPALLFAFGWIALGETDGVWAVFGGVSAFCAVATVACTAMIYQSLKPIQRWSNAWVLPNYLTLAAMTGALWLAALASLFTVSSLFTTIAALATIALGAALKLGYWHHIDNSSSASTAGTATGLGPLGEVRLFEAPHTSENYLMKEMGYRIARKHAAKLRTISLVAGFALPFVLSLAALAFSGSLAAGAGFAAALLSTAGVLVERWLFFAEAKHTVTLFYGAARA
ncbi:MAG TPA: DmsC/YnfH family molybdoenzyme membrane anchor subunit [Stellaceae bacterium]|nr:DmsC/YnfH family molybdoenzyme membrane anchor subunit [Stellaceae bacterium]